MRVASAVRVNSSEYVGLVSVAPMSACVMNAMEMTNMILLTDLSVMTGSFLPGKFHTLHM